MANLTNRSGPALRRILISAFSTVALGTAVESTAAVMLVSTTQTVTLTAPASTTYYDITVPGFDPSLGTLNDVYLEIDTTSYNSTLFWTLRNDSSKDISGSNAYFEGQSFRVLRPDNNASLRGLSGSSSATGGFFLAPGAQTTVNGHGSNGSAGGNVSGTANRNYFISTDPVPLRLQAEGTYLDLTSGLTIVDQGGSVMTDVLVNVRYYYAAFNPTPPGATPIVISSSTTGTLANSEVDWYVFEYGGGELTIDTNGSALMPDNDTIIALYNADGQCIRQDDDSGDGYLSRIHVADGVLSAGTYYIAVAGYGFSTSLGNDFEAISDSYYTGTYQLNLTGTAVPEPTAAGFALAGLGGLLLNRRRRWTPTASNRGEAMEFRPGHGYAPEGAGDRFRLGNPAGSLLPPNTPPPRGV